MTTTAKIAAKGCDSTGITEDIAQQLHNNLGRKIVAVVELVAEARSEKRNGDETVTLSILTIEPAPNTDTEEHLRELARAFYYERSLDSQQPTLGDDINPNVSDVINNGLRHRPHPYLASTLSTDDTEHGPVCDVCGLLERASVHSTQDFLPAVDEDDEEPQLDDDETEDESGQADEDDAPWDEQADEPTRLPNPFTTTPA